MSMDSFKSDGGSNAAARVANNADAVQAAVSADPAPETPAAPPPEPLQTPDPELDSSFFKSGDTRPKDAEPKAADDVPKDEKAAKPNAPATIRKVKAGGRTHEVDLSDEAKLDKLLSMGIEGKKLFSKVAKLEQQLKSYTKGEAAEKLAMWDRLEEAADNPKELIKLITGGSKSLDDFVKEAKEQEEFYQTATPEEIEQFELRQRLARVEQAEERRKAELEAERTQAEQRVYDSEKKVLKQRLHTELRKHSFQGKVSDEADAQELDRMMHTRAIQTIKGWMSKHGEDLEEVPDQLISKAYQRAATFINKFTATQAEEKVSQLDQARSKEAETNAQLASTKNYGGMSSDFEKQLRSKAGRMTEMMKLFRK